MRALVFTLAALVAIDAHAGKLDGDCQEFAERSALQPASGVRRVVIISGAGFLHVEGGAGATEIRATGRACAPIEELLVGIRLDATRSGSTVTIKATVPKEEGSFFASAPRLDFTVTLPAGIAIDVADTAGDIDIRDVGTARVINKTGPIAIRNVVGNLSVQTTSGAIGIEDVSGDVHVPSDASGNIRIERVGGSVNVDRDGSGSMVIRNVKRNVTIAADTSGAVTVSGVGGDFALGSKGSGSVSYERVSGHVWIPRRFRK
jgi:hypothetical protein